MRRVLLFALSFLLFCCTKRDKDSYITGQKKTPLEDSAMAILKRNMANSDFARLDWSKITVVYKEDTPYVLEIPDLKDTAQHLIFAYQNSQPIYHWVKLVITGKDPQYMDLPNGQLILTDVSNRVFKNYKMEHSFAKKDKSDLQTETLHMLDPVTVYSTYSGFDFSSLYWAMGGNSNYSGQYSGIVYPSSMYSSGGGGSVSGTYQNPAGIPGRTVVVDKNTTPGRYILGNFICSYNISRQPNGNDKIVATCKDRFVFMSFIFSFEINPNTLIVNNKTFQTYIRSGLWVGTFDLKDVTTTTVSNGIANFSFSVQQTITEPTTTISHTNYYNFDVTYNPKRYSLTIDGRIP